MAEQKNIKKLVQLQVDEVKEFNNVIATRTVRSKVLEEEIAGLFGSIFADFEGCKIGSAVDPKNPNNKKLKCRLYFKPETNKDEKSLYAIKVNGENIINKKGNLYDWVETVNSIKNAKTHELEFIAKEILQEFIFDPTARMEDRCDESGNTVKVRVITNWKPYVSEIDDAVAGGFLTRYIAVDVDLLPIVAKMHGKKDPKEVKEGAAKGYIPRDKYQYSVTEVRMLSPNESILEIRRLDIKEMSNLSKSIGYGMVAGNVVMTRR